MKEYAILIPVVEAGGEKALLMEVRSDKVKQPGEVCFPGGRVEPGETAEEAAIRETTEELSISADDIDICDEQAAEIIETSIGRRVYAFSAGVRIGSPEDLELSEDEVAGVFLLPLSWLRDNRPRRIDLASPEEDIPAILRSYLKNYSRDHLRGETDYWEYDGHGIWGLTARLIRTLLETREL